MEITPYRNSGETKKKQVTGMFDNIAGTYDLLNHLLSGGVDIWWRKKAISMLSDLKPLVILDLASGTGDFAIEAARTLKPKAVIGIDISEKMLAIAREKVQRSNIQGIVSFTVGDAENLPFDDAHFNAETVAFGVRNYESLPKGLREMYRVLKPGGECVILEFSNPKRSPFKQLYHFYSRFIMPAIGKIVSKDQSAYKYLPASVREFPDGEKFLGLMREAGFNNTRCIPLTFGICSIYTGCKS